MTMLDLAYIREHADEIKSDLVKLNASAPIDEILSLDEKRRACLQEVEMLRAQRNTVSKQISRMKDAQQRQALIDEMRQVGDRIAVQEVALGQVEERLQAALLEVPNLPDPSVPVGKDDSENIVVRTVGELPQFPFEPLPHWELGPSLGIIDFERGVKLSGTRFYVLSGAAARLQRALIAWMLELHIQKHGYREVYVPFMVRRECLVGTGQLPKFGDNLYHDAEEDYWFIPTAAKSSIRGHCRSTMSPIAPASGAKKCRQARTLAA
jgi:seryl-tRNA synthetase